MSWNVIRLLLLPGWMAAIWGSLQLHTMNLHLGHSICGPWGCGPPAEALLGFHSFWLVLILPLAAVIGAYLPIRIVRIMGLALAALGAMGILSYVAWDLIDYARKGADGYFVQRGLFTLVTAVDFPMIQLTLAGVLLVYRFGPKPPAVDPARTPAVESEPVAVSTLHGSASASARRSDRHVDGDDLPPE